MENKNIKTNNSLDNNLNNSSNNNSSNINVEIDIIMNSYNEYLEKRTIFYNNIMHFINFWNGLNDGYIPPIRRIISIKKETEFLNIKYELKNYDKDTEKIQIPLSFISNIREFEEIVYKYANDIAEYVGKFIKVDLDEYEAKNLNELNKYNEMLNKNKYYLDIKNKIIDLEEESKIIIKNIYDTKERNKFKKELKFKIELLNKEIEKIKITTIEQIRFNNMNESDKYFFQEYLNLKQKLILLTEDFEDFDMDSFFQTYYNVFIGYEIGDEVESEYDDYYY